MISFGRNPAQISAYRILQTNLSLDLRPVRCTFYQIPFHRRETGERMDEVTGIIEEISSIARQAGDIALRSFGRVSPEMKADRSFVTEADRRVEEFIREQLASRFPADNVIGEEDIDKSDGSSGYTWAIDPIDGTTNYVFGVPYWAVCIGRIAADGTPDLGVVNVPAMDELYTGALGNGATVNGRTLKMAVPAFPEHELLLGAWSTFYREIELDFQGKVRVLGSTVIKFLNMARGMFIGALTPTVHIWDVAPGFPILREAGGDICLRDGTPYERFDLDPKHEFLVPPLVLAASSEMDRIRGMIVEQRKHE
ncbi:MAG TPA: hypothetical protein ENN56_00925 [Firmicutes bacterium]|nr:hypothetical protein [Bacillota bacterium]